MVLHVFQAAVIGQTVKKVSDGLFRLHLSTSPAWNLATIYARPVEFDIPGLKTSFLYENLLLVGSRVGAFDGHYRLYPMGLPFRPP